MLHLRLLFQAYCVYYESSFGSLLYRIRVLDEMGFCCEQGCVERSSCRLCSSLNLGRVWSVGRASRCWVKRSECCIEQDSSLLLTSNTGKPLQSSWFLWSFLCSPGGSWCQASPGQAAGRADLQLTCCLEGRSRGWCALLAIESS